MPRFVLDTDTCSDILNRSNPLVLKRLPLVSVNGVCMSVSTKAEPLHGVEASLRRAQDAAALAAFLPYSASPQHTEDLNRRRREQ